jgi:membrane fusion protein (multidrug efflux system)
VAGLGAGTGSALSVLPAQNATGNWVKVVQRLPVRIRLDRAQLHDAPLRLGLSMTVTIDVHDKSGAVLATEPPGAPPYTIAGQADELGKADRLIERIIAENAGRG